MSASRTYFLSKKIFNINSRESRKKHVQTCPNGEKLSAVRWSVDERIQTPCEKHEKERCVKCLPLSPVCCWLHCCSSPQLSKRAKQKTKKNDATLPWRSPRTVIVCDFFTNSYHPFPPCRGCRWWRRRRGDLTHINSINSGRETRSNDMKKKWNLQTTDTRQSARSVPGVTVWKWHRLLSVASAFDGTLH